HQVHPRAVRVSDVYRDVAGGLGDEHLEVRAPLLGRGGGFVTGRRYGAPVGGLGGPHLGLAEPVRALRTRRLLGDGGGALGVHRPQGAGATQVGAAVVVDGQLVDEGLLGDTRVGQHPVPAPRTDEPGKRVDLRGQTVGQNEGGHAPMLRGPRTGSQASRMLPSMKVGAPAISGGNAAAASAGSGRTDAGKRPRMRCTAEVSTPATSPVAPPTAGPTAGSNTPATSPAPPA